MVLGDTNGVVYLWGIDGSLKRTLVGFKGETRKVAFSPAGALVMATSAAGGTTVWTTAGDAALSIPPGVITNSFLPSENLLVGSSDEGLKIWDIAFRRQTTIGYPVLNVYDLVVSSDGEQAVSIGNQIDFWNLKDSKHLKTLSVHEAKPFWNSSAEWSDDGLFFGAFRLFERSQSAGATFDNELVVGPNNDGSDPDAVMLMDRKTLDVRGYLRGHTNVVESVVFSPTEMIVVTASRDSTARIWKRVRPDQWWGIATLPLFWAFLGSLLGFVVSTRRDFVQYAQERSRQKDRL